MMNVELYIDPIESKNNKMLRSCRLNVVTIPILRVLGFSILSIVLLLHNQIVFGSDLTADLKIPLIIVYLYCFMSWGVLYKFYAYGKRLDLGVFFLGFDIIAGDN
jgi:hypothetical protein